MSRQSPFPRTRKAARFLFLIWGVIAFPHSIQRARRNDDLVGLCR